MPGIPVSECNTTTTKKYGFVPQSQDLNVSLHCRLRMELVRSSFPFQMSPGPWLERPEASPALPSVLTDASQRKWVSGYQRPSFLEQRLDTRWMAWRGGMLHGGSRDLQMLWVAEGAEVKATCHLNGEGNKSQARGGLPPSDMGQWKGNHALTTRGHPHRRPSPQPAEVLRLGVHAQAALATSGSSPVVQSQPASLAGKFQVPRTPGTTRTLAAQARHSQRCLHQVSPLTCVSAFLSSHHQPTDCILRCRLERAPRRASTTFLQQLLSHQEQGQGPCLPHWALDRLATSQVGGQTPFSRSPHQATNHPKCLLSSASSSMRTAQPGGALPWGFAQGGRGASVNRVRPGRVSPTGPQHVVGWMGQSSRAAVTRGAAVASMGGGNMHRGAGAELAQNTRKQGG